MSSAICFNLDQSEILLSSNGLYVQAGLGQHSENLNPLPDNKF